MGLNSLKKISSSIQDSYITRVSNRETVSKVFPIFEPHPGAQKRIVDLLKTPNDAIALWYKGGINSGKSFAGAWFCHYRSELDPEGRGLITANTFGQLKTSTIVALADYCEMFGVKLTPQRDNSEETAKAIVDNEFCRIGEHQAFFYVLSAERFIGKSKNSRESGRGIQVRHIWFDEGAYSDRSAFETVMGRRGRGKGSAKGLMLVTSSINKNHPRNFMYDYFDSPKRGEDLIRKFISVAGSSLENIHADPEYIEDMKATLTPELYKLEILSEYATITEGMVFKYFKRDFHTVPQSVLSFDPSEPLHLSFDFNHNPATCIAAQVIQDELRILKEFYLLNSNTFELIEEVIGFVTPLKPSLILLHGDASGNQKTANSKNTNWGIIRNALWEDFTFETRFKSVNPSILDSVNALNSSFIHNRVFISDDCLELIADMEFLRWTDSSEIDKKTDPMRSHLADCLRYLNWDIFPLVRKRTTPDTPTVWG